MAALSSRYTYEGTETTETSITRVGSPADPTGQQQSRKIITTANSQWLRPFQAEPYVVWNPTAGANVDVTVYGTVNAGALPLNDEIFMEVEYLARDILPTFTPASLTGLIGWWDASVPASLSLTGSSINSVADQSSAGNNLTWTNAKPTYNATGFNSRPAIMMDALVGTALTNAAFPMGTGNTLTLFYIGTIGTSTSQNNGRFISYRAPGQSGDYTNVASWVMSRPSVGTTLMVTRNSSDSTAFSVTGDPAPHRFIVTVSPSGVTTIYVDGVPTVGTTVLATWITGGTLSVGRNVVPGTENLTAPFAEFGVATGFSDATTVAALDTYLRNKWQPVSPITGKLVTTTKANVLATPAAVSADASSWSVPAVLSGAPLDAVASVTGAWSLGRNMKTSFGAGTRYTKIGTAITALNDQSGNNRHFNDSATPARRPTEVTAFPANVLCADFDGIGNNLINVSFVNLISNSSGAIVVSVILDAVTQNNAISSYNDAIIADDAGYTGLFARNLSGVTLYGYNWDGTEDAASTTGAIGTPYVLMWRHYGGVVYLSVNGGAEVPIASGATTSLGGFLRLGLGGVPGSYCNCKIAEVFVTSDGSQIAALSAAVGNMMAYIGVAAYTPFKLTTTLSSPQPGLAGYINARIRAAKPSTTYYIDPTVVLTPAAGGTNNVATAYTTSRYAYEGTETTETSITRVNGAQDPTLQKQSRKVVTSANSQWLRPFKAEPYATWNNTIGSDLTVSVCGTVNSGSLPLNDEIWMDCEYLTLANQAVPTQFDGPNATVTLSNGNCTVTRDAFGTCSARSTTFLSSGKYYFEVTDKVLMNVTDGCGIVTSAGGVFDGPANASGVSVSYGSGSTYIYAHGVNSTKDLGTTAINDVFGLAYDLTNRLFWARRNAGNWNNDATANPATGVGGVSFNAGSYTPKIYFASGPGPGSGVQAANFGAAAYVYTPPAGFSNWATPAAPLGKIVSTTKSNILATPAAVAADGSSWSNTQYANFNGVNSSLVTLSNYNLIVTCNQQVASYYGARSKSVQTTGKYYFECTVSHTRGTFHSGLLLSTGTYADLSSGINCVDATGGGFLYSNNGNQGNALGAFVAGEVICFAIDLTARKAWVRRNNGNWLGSGTANPATGVGGVTIGAGAFSPMVGFGGGSQLVGDNWVANFGLTTYAQTPPSGFGNWPGSWSAFKLITTLNAPQPGVAGYIHTRVRAAKPSTAYYIDPQITVAPPSATRSALVAGPVMVGPGLVRQAFVHDVMVNL